MHVVLLDQSEKPLWFCRQAKQLLQEFVPEIQNLDELACEDAYRPRNKMWRMKVNDLWELRLKHGYSKDDLHKLEYLSKVLLSCPGSYFATVTTHCVSEYDVLLEACVHLLPTLLNERERELPATSRCMQLFRYACHAAARAYSRLLHTRASCACTSPCNALDVLSLGARRSVKL